MTVLAKDLNKGDIKLFSSDRSSEIVIVCNDTSEQAYLLDWCERKNKKVSDWMFKNKEFPICYGCNGEIVGWIRLMNRAIGYKDFRVFYNQLMDGVK